MENIDIAKLATVEGGAGHKSATRAPAVSPLDPFGVGAFWQNYWGAVTNFAPPFSTTPLFPHPFE